MIISRLLAPVLLHWVRRGVLIFAGLVITMIGFTVACGGIGGATSLATDLVLGSAPPDQAGAASAVSETGNELGIGLGIAPLGSVGTRVCRTALDHQADPGAADRISKAPAVAAELPPGQGELLAASARQAFTQDLVVVAALGAVVLAAVARASWRRLARTPEAAEPAGPAAEMRPEQQVTLR